MVEVLVAVMILLAMRKQNLGRLKIAWLKRNEAVQLWASLFMKENGLMGVFHLMQSLQTFQGLER